MPVQNIEEAAEFYRSRLGFVIEHLDPDFATMRRDGVELHLWAATDQSWRSRPSLALRPVGTGAESFIAGTASCRIEVDSVVAVYAEATRQDVLHPADQGGPANTEWGTREFAALGAWVRSFRLTRRGKSGGQCGALGELVHGGGCWSGGPVRGRAG